MFYNDELVYIHIPKTGGKFLKEKFKNTIGFNSRLNDCHFNLNHYIENNAELNLKKRKYFIATTFNPYKRAVSIYHHLKREGDTYKFNSIIQLFRNLDEVSNIWIYKPMSYYYDKKIKFYKMEEINNWGNNFYGIKITNQKKIDSSKYNRWQKYYKRYPCLKDIIYVIYKKDFIKFNYNKDNLN